MSYTLRFSDLTKDGTVTVPDMPPGINTVDTSLSLVGRGYPNYGEKIAENFLHLLENFSGPIPPENPIEGQLWYDTSDTSRKVLRVMDGTATSTRWPNANGIYQQGTDPKSSAASLKDGDIWVDTAAIQLKIYKSGVWTTVGPTVASGGSKTGIEADTIVGKANGSSTTSTFNVIYNYIGGEIVSIIANDDFVPYPVAIANFTTIKPGVNIRSSSDPTVSVRFYGDADRATNLKVSGTTFAGTEFLRKNDYSNRGQIVRGHIVFTQSTDSAKDDSLVNNGLVIDSGIVTEYLQLFKENNNAVLHNNVSDKNIIFRTSLGGVSLDALTVKNTLVAIDTTATISKSLSVAGILSISTSSETAVSVTGGVSVGKNINITGGLAVTGVTTASNTINVNTILPNTTDTYDIGSLSKRVRNLYVSNLYSTVSVYTTSLNATSVSAVSITANNSAVNFPGTVTPYGGATAPTGWLLCNGTGYSTSTYVALHSLIGYTYGGSAGTFNVPNITPISATTGTVSYIIKT